MTEAIIGGEQKHISRLPPRVGTIVIIQFTGFLVFVSDLNSDLVPLLVLIIRVKPDYFSQVGERKGGWGELTLTQFR